MIKQKTTFVLGAGASMAYGFPSGKTLKALIWKRFSITEPSSDFRQQQFSGHFYKAAGCHVVDCAEKVSFEKKIKEFCDSLAISPDETIDYFLEHVGDNTETKNKYRMIGRLAIADILLECEQKQYLFDDWMTYHSIEKEHLYTEFFKNSRIRPDDGHWYQFLFNQMCRDCPSVDNFPDNNVSIITFNYDRSFEYYFLNALMAKYKVSSEKAAEVLNRFDIVHVYGQLGELPELVPDDQKERKVKAVSYMALTESKRDRFLSLKNAADGIQLIWDSQGETANTQKAKDLIYSEKNKVIFLGFGFDPINLSRIMPVKKIEVDLNIEGHGTIYGLSKQRIKNLESDYKLMYPNGMTKGFFNGQFMGVSLDTFVDCKIYNFLYNSTGLLR